MSILKYAAYAAIAAAVLIVLITAFRRGHGLRTLCWSAVSGVAALGIVALVGHFTVFTLAVNAWSVLCSAVLGVPGVLLMLAVKFVWVL